VSIQLDIAAMNVHGVKLLLTFNVKDFARYTGITVLDAASADSTLFSTTDAGS
jgi:hypothetical protein